MPRDPFDPFDPEGLPPDDRSRAEELEEQTREDFGDVDEDFDQEHDIPWWEVGGDNYMDDTGHDPRRHF